MRSILRFLPVMLVLAGPALGAPLPVPPGGTATYNGNVISPYVGNEGLYGTQYGFSGYSNVAGTITWGTNTYLLSAIPTGPSFVCATVAVTPCWLVIGGSVSAGNVGVKFNDTTSVPTVLKAEIFVNPAGNLVFEPASGSPGVLSNPMTMIAGTGELDLPGVTVFSPLASLTPVATQRGGCYFNTTINHVSCIGGTAGAPTADTPVYIITGGAGTTVTSNNGSASVVINTDGATTSATGGGALAATGYEANATNICGVQAANISCGPLWQASTAYTTTSVVTTIVAGTAGAAPVVRNYSPAGPCTSAITPPTGTGTGISDGTGGCSWNYNAAGIGAACTFNAAGTLTCITLRQTLTPGATPNQVVDVSQKGANGGVATLTGTGVVPIAQIPTGQTGTTVPLGNDARIVGAVQTANNGSDFANLTTTKTNLQIPTAGTGLTNTANVFSVTYGLTATSALRGDTVFSQPTCTNYAASGTWTKVGTFVDVWVVGAGGGGGKGPTASASGSGGAGGGGGAFTFTEFPTALLTTTVTLTIGTGGTGSTGTGAGGIGGNTTFGNYLWAAGGGGGADGAASTASGGGGSGGPNNPGTSGAGATAGSAGGISGNGGAGVASAAVLVSGPGSGGAGSGATGTAFSSGQAAQGASGGASGGGDAAGTFQPGGSSGVTQAKGAIAATGGAATGVAGGAGVSPNVWPNIAAATGGGGGGGNGSGAGGAGGAGGFPGGGGGGGGSGSSSGGNGGAGGNGEMEVCSF